MHKRNVQTAALSLLKRMRQMKKKPLIRMRRYPKRIRSKMMISAGLILRMFPLGELIEHFEDKNELIESKNNQSEDDVKRARADNEPKYRTDTRFKRNAIRCVRNDRITVT